MAKKKDYVPIELCTARHNEITRRLDVMEKDVLKIKVALIGENLKGGGLVQEVRDLKNKIRGSLSGKDKAAILIALISGIVAVIVAFLK